MKKLTTKQIMNTNPRDIKDKLTALKTIMNAANSRIYRMKQKGYEPLESHDFNLNKNKRFQLPKNRDSRTLEAKIREIKNFMNSPSNSLTKINKNKNRLEEHYGHKISNRDFKEFRQKSRSIWSEIKEETENLQITSSVIEGIILDSYINKSAKTFEEQLNYIRNEYEKRNLAEKRRKELLLKKFRPRF